MCTKVIEMFEIKHSNQINRKNTNMFWSQDLAHFCQWRILNFLQTQTRGSSLSSQSVANLQDRSIWQERSQVVMCPQWDGISTDDRRPLKKTFHLIISEFSFHVEATRGKTLKKPPIKLLQLKMIFYVETNKDSYFPAEDFNFASFFFF